MRAYSYSLLQAVPEDLGKHARGRSRFFFRGGALVSCSTSTPINHIVHTPCTLPLDPPLHANNQWLSQFFVSACSVLQ